MADLALRLQAGVAATRWSDPALFALGRDVHTRYQAAAACGDPRFQAERPVRGRLCEAGTCFELRGRVDGVRTRADGALEVEELKTVAGGAPSDALSELARLQISLYAWLLQREGSVVARSRIIWLRPDTDGNLDARCEDVEPDFATLETRVRAALAELAEAEARAEARRALRRSAAPAIRLPHPTPRAGQPEITEAVERALEHGEHLLVEAPTGVGKTAAVLTPVLRHALARDRRVFVLSARNLQQSASLETLERLLPAGTGPVTQLHAHRALCANPGGFCHEDHCSFARQYGSRARASGVLEASDVVRAPLLRTLGAEHTLCPVALGRDLALASAVTVCDSNFALDPGARMAAFAPEAPLHDVILVIDEAHQLADRARDNLSTRLQASAVRRARERAAWSSTAAMRDLAAALAEVLEGIEATVSECLGGIPDEDFAVQAALPESRLGALAGLLGDALVGAFDALPPAAGEPEPVFAVHGALRQLARLAARPDEARPALLTRRDGDLALESICLDPSFHLGPIFARCHTVIGMSATLSPRDYHADVLGLDRDRLATVRVGSPFPSEHRALVIDDGIDTRFRRRGREAPRVAHRLAAFAEAVPGNCLALLPSFAFLEQVAGHLEVPGRRLLRQEPGLDEAARTALLDILREPAAEPALLLAVAGGVFAEGIDLPGDALQAVAVVGPCLPPRTPERELLAALCEERYGAGFAYAYAIPGITRVIQGAGRLIRSPRDRGVVALLGKRFLTAPFEELLGEGLPEGGDPAIVGTPAEIAREFYAGPG